MHSWIKQHLKLKLFIQVCPRLSRHSNCLSLSKLSLVTGMLTLSEETAFLLEQRNGLAILQGNASCFVASGYIHTENKHFGGFFIQAKLCQKGVHSHYSSVIVVVAMPYEVLQHWQKYTRNWEEVMEHTCMQQQKEEVCSTIAPGMTQLWSQSLRTSVLSGEPGQAHIRITRT